MIADIKRPVAITYLALYLSPIIPNTHFPTPYIMAAIEITIPMSDFVRDKSEHIAGIAIEKFCLIR
jgi:hypothetical protein